jgi:hypothetical protein
VARGKTVTVEPCGRTAAPDPPVLGTVWKEERSRFALSKDGCHLAILHQGQPALAVWDIPRRQAVADISVPRDAIGIEYSPAGGRGSRYW